MLLTPTECMKPGTVIQAAYIRHGPHIFPLEDFLRQTLPSHTLLRPHPEVLTID